MKINATNIADWMKSWDNFNYELYLAILKSRQE